MVSVRVSLGGDAVPEWARRLVRCLAGGALILAVLACAAGCGTDTNAGEDNAGQDGREVATYVVWEESIPCGEDSSYNRIHLLDLDSGEESELAGSEDVYVSDPAVSGRLVVWEETTSEGAREDRYIVAHDLAKGDGGPLPDSDGNNPAVSGLWIVWRYDEKSEGEWRTVLVARDLASGLERRIELPHTAIPPTYSVSGDWLVWDVKKGFDEKWHDLSQIWGMRLSTGKRTLLRPKGTYCSPAVAGDWVLCGRSDRNRVDALNLRTREVSLLPRGATTVCDGQRVIIVKGGEAAAQAGRSRMFVYELASGRSTPVPVGPGRFGSLGIHGEWLIWREPQGSLAPAPLRAVNYVTGESLTVAEGAMETSISRD